MPPKTHSAFVGSIHTLHPNAMGIPCAGCSLLGTPLPIKDCILSHGPMGFQIIPPHSDDSHTQATDGAVQENLAFQAAHADLLKLWVDSFDVWQSTFNSIQNGAAINIQQNSATSNNIHQHPTASNSSQQHPIAPTKPLLCVFDVWPSR